MYLFKKFLLLAIIFALGQSVEASLPGGQALAADNSNRPGQRAASPHETFARDFAQTVLAIIQDTKKSFADRKAVLRQAFSDSVDIDWIAKFVLGKSWATATEAQKTRYVSLYRKYLTETYVSNFAENPDRRIRDIKIYGVNEEEDADFTVRTEMMLADQENLQVNYRVSEQAGMYRVRDIAIENVSLIATHRTEFHELAVTKGVEGVITALEQKVNRHGHPGSNLAFSMN